MYQERFFKDSNLPFAECKFTQNSSESFKPHLHHTFCIGGLEKGLISLQVGGKKALLQPGAVALINPDTLHACNPEEQDKRSFYMLYLDLDRCLKIQQSLWQNSAFVPVDCIVARDITLYDFYIDVMDSLTGESHLLEKEQKLVYLAEAVFARCCLPTVPTLTEPQYVSELKEWLTSDLESDQTLEIFASQKNSNPYTLLRHFRVRYGVTPHAFRMNCRIEHARELLQREYDLGDVAQMCGFYDQSHLHRYFKAMTSVTPRVYQLNRKSS